MTIPMMILLNGKYCTSSPPVGNTLKRMSVLIRTESVDQNGMSSGWAIHQEGKDKAINIF